MRGLETLVGQRLKERKPLSDLLCAYNGKPAVFYQLAPSDSSPGWSRAADVPPDAPAQYPRLIYDFDKLADTERKSSGTLIVYSFCDRQGTEPEKLEPLIRNCLKDVLMKPDGGFPYCFAWSRTEPFEMAALTEGMKNRGVIGQEIRFDIVEYPRQETTDPDPVAALNRFLAEAYPECVIVGESHMEPFTETGTENPALYCRLIRTETEDISNTVVWMKADIAIHVICPDAETRLKLSADIQNRIAIPGEMRMLDRSIMRPDRLSMNNTADYLKEGQLHGAFHYGVFRYLPEPKKLNRAHMKLGRDGTKMPYIVDYNRG